MNRETTPPLEVLMAASLYLMTRYAEKRRPEMAVALAQPSNGSASTGVRALAARQGLRTPLARMAASGTPDIAIPYTPPLRKRSLYDGYQPSLSTL
jgi:hypothetical protein